MSYPGSPPPPPWANITGISRTVMKDNAQETIGNYNGNARPGEIVVDLTTDPPTPYIGNNAGDLTLLTSAGTYGNTQVGQYLASGAVGNIIPSGNGVYSLGNSTNYWSNVWITGNTLYLGGVPLGMSGNVLTVDGNSVLINNTDENISTSGNVTAGNIDITRGNLNWANASIVQTSNVDLSITGDGQVTVRSLDGTYQWTFDNAGNLTAPGNIGTSANVSAGYFIGNGAFLTGISGGGGNIGNLAVTGTNIGIANGAPETTMAFGGAAANVIVDTNTGAPKINIYAQSTDFQSYSQGDSDYTSAEWVTDGGGGAINITGAQSYVESFVATLNQYALVTMTINSTDTVPYNGASYGGGSITLFTNTAPATSPTAVTAIAFNLTFDNGLYMDPDEGDMLLKIGDFNLNIRSLRDINITSSDDLRLLGNDITRLAGNADVTIVSAINTDPNYAWIFGTDGNLTLPDGTPSINYANGAPYSAGAANTGNVTFDNQVIQGTGDEYGGGGLYLAPGNNSTANLQYLRVRGGDNPTHIHFDTGNTAYYDQYFGDDNKYVKLEAGSNGNIVVGAQGVSQNYVWTFGSDGNFVLANGLSIIQSTPNSSLDPVNPNVSTMVLTPDSSYSYQALVLDPTAPGHIHLRAPSGSGNIDEPTANLFLGGEQSSFEIGASYGQPPNVFVHSGGNTWTFGTDGNLGVAGNVYFSGDASSAPSLNDFFSITSAANFAVVTDSANTQQTWNFDSTGNLTLPSSGHLIVATGIVGSGASPAPYLSGFSNVSAINLNASGNVSTTGNITGNYFIGDGSQLSSINAATADILNTNGLTTVFYPTFVEDRANQQTLRADVDLSYRTDNNTLTVGNLVTSGSGGDITLTGGDILGVNIVVTTPTALANLTPVAGGRAFVNNSNVAAVGNFGNLVSSGGSNIVPVWSDGISWYIG